MRRLLLIFICAFCVLFAFQSHSDSLPISEDGSGHVTTNVLIIPVGDSFETGLAGNGHDVWNYTTLQLMHSEVYWMVIDSGQSGQNNWSLATNNMAAVAKPAAATQHGTNIVWVWPFVSGNGGFAASANTNFYQTNIDWMLQFPTITFRPDAVPTNDWPWSTNLLYHTVFADTVYPGSASSALTTVFVYSAAGSNAAWLRGWRYIDSASHTFYETSVWATNQTLANEQFYPVGYGGIAAGHPQKRTHQFNRHLGDMAQIGLDTNVWSFVLDWNSISVPSTATNHLALGTPTNTSQSYSVPILLDRMWGPIEVADSAHTNDVSEFLSITPYLTNFVKELSVWSNAPPGTFVYYWDGEPCATNASVNGFLTNNWWTTLKGPLQRQRLAVMDNFRRMKDIDTTNGCTPSGMIYDRNFQSIAGSWWTTNYSISIFANLLQPAANTIAGLARTNQTVARQTLHTLSVSNTTVILPAASITASAITNALNVPVVLDGSASIFTSNYLWSQTSGSTVDFIGQGMPKIMVISVTNAGNYTFQLIAQGMNGNATNSVTITFIAPTGGHTNYVDGNLSANTATYSIANRNGSGTDGNGYTNIQNAVGASVAGDMVYIRGGLYSVGIVNGALINQYTVNVTNSGTATSPIRIENYPGDYVRISGWGFSDADTNSDGLADGVISNSNYRQTLFFISPGANYIQVGGLDLSNAQNNAMTVEGNYCYVREVSAHDNWFTGIAIAKDQLATNGTVHGDVLRYVEAYNNRHFTGILIGFSTQQTFGFMQDCAVVDSISYWNGYKPNGVRVLPSGNDSQGGGNSGGFWTTKYFADNAVFTPTNGIRNYGLNLYFIRDISWNNSDDGFAFDHAESLIADNRSLFNGPTGAMGYKFLRYVQNNTLSGNVAYGNQGRGFELRADTNAFIKVFNNTSVKNAGYGFWIAGLDATTLPIETNNVAAFNGQTDWPNGFAYNWAADGLNVQPAYKGDPHFVSTNITIPGTGSFTNGVTVKQKRDYIEALVDAALAPTNTSPLLRAGLLIPSYHTPTADDDAANPMPAAAIGRHWLTNAPDIGALSVLSTNIVIQAPNTNLARFWIYR